MLYAVIDIGSNTIKCSVYEHFDKIPNLISYLSEPLGLISKIKDGILPPQAINELLKTLNMFLNKIPNSEKIFCFATETMRRISNFDAIKSEIKKTLSLDVELISSKDEAMLSFKGFCAYNPSIKNGIMVDMGGGSTEILKFENRTPIDFNSFKFGCLYLKNKYQADNFPTNNESEQIYNDITLEVSNCKWINRTDNLCLTGGTANACKELANAKNITLNNRLTPEEFDLLLSELSKLNKATFDLIYQTIPQRAKTILPGLCAYKAIIDIVKPKTIIISDAGIRDGYLIKKLNEEKF